MRNDFAVFILTHGRADNVVTVPAIKKAGYTGKIYFIIDDEDEQAEEYKKNFGADRVIIFDKQAAYDRADTMDNFNDHRAIIYARNECWRIAEELGLKYFLMLDDDYKSIDYRYEEDGKLKYKPSHDFDRVFEDMIQFLEVSGADTVAFCQGGDFVGGVDGGNFHKGLLRKAMNSFFCKTDTPIEYRGTMNEDVVTYTTLSSRGHLFFSNTQYCVVQLPTQSLSGGMTDAYKEGGTYLKTFYAIMSMPSAVKVSMMYTTHKRIHHRINWEHTAPKILNEKWRKERKEDINTLITPADNQDDGWKKIRRVKTRFELIRRMNAAADALVGKVDNDKDGRSTVVSQLQAIGDNMIAEGKLTAITVSESTVNVADGDSAWFDIDVVDKDSMEHIYLSYRFQFSTNA